MRVNNDDLRNLRNKCQFALALVAHIPTIEYSIGMVNPLI